MAQKDPSLGARFSKIRSVFCDGKNLLFAQKIGVSPQNSSGYCSGLTPIGPKIIEQALKAFPQVNRVWLILGEGDMIKAETPIAETATEASAVATEKDKSVPHINESENTLDVINRLVTIIENKDKQVASLISMLGERTEKPSEKA